MFSARISPFGYDGVLAKQLQDMPPARPSELSYLLASNARLFTGNLEAEWLTTI